MYPNTLKALAAVGLLSLLPTIAVAAPPAGTWRGLATSSNTDIATTIRFNGQQADIQFSNPVSCTVTAKVLSQSGGSTTYRIGASKNGGKFCEELFGHNLQATTQGGGLHIRFDAARGSWQGDLRQ